MREIPFLGTPVQGSRTKGRRIKKAKMNPRFLTLAVSWRVVLLIEVRIVTSLWGEW